MKIQKPLKFVTENHVLNARQDKVCEDKFYSFVILNETLYVLPENVSRKTMKLCH